MATADQRGEFPWILLCLSAVQRVFLLCLALTTDILYNKKSGWSAATGTAPLPRHPIPPSSIPLQSSPSSLFFPFFSSSLCLYSYLIISKLSRSPHHLRHIYTSTYIYDWVVLSLNREKKKGLLWHHFLLCSFFFSFAVVLFWAC